mmetsp:Transcript_45572/g.75976  ORF Transcript_45572/g.75976 Transcript_45572/m.75976 type:complete len:142 (+) Transcript_45572:83-508(+)|eukprot:CAMPEP_0198208872 /NCGR_PEP_ID=MMETSP1445-20131203/12208_1 /TAXON_ID=36898 /ORGANISM="Pyramimonas sp., Strain CCMP2087" /LENGTH=141 /DNA_ID=CAMNT_0043882437 /DNA_START=74 /DNA_END=499 /DNA_ORIENTATION=+
MAGAASGVAVDDNCVSTFMDLKKKRKYRWVVYKIDGEKKVILEATGEPDASYESFTEMLPEHECRYGLYDHDYVDIEGCQKSKIVFFAWSPDTAKVKMKMLYASSKDSFRRLLDGIHFEIQATDASEVEMKEIQAKCGPTL